MNGYLKNFDKQIKTLQDVYYELTELSHLIQPKYLTVST